MLGGNRLEEEGKAGRKIKWKRVARGAAGKEKGKKKC